MRMMTPPITAARLAKETGVSRRSLYRDIEALRSAGARIEGERGYGYTLREDNALRPQAFTRGELEAIALGLAEVRSMGDPYLAKEAASVLAKVIATLPDNLDQQLLHAISHVYRPDARLAPAPASELVREACWHENALHIAYADHTSAFSERKIYPLALMYTERTQTLLAWCCLRKEFRMFRLDRMSQVTWLEESFRPRRATLLRDYMNILESQAAGRIRPG